MNEDEIASKLKTAQINNALGIFILIFGIIVIIAMVSPDTFAQQMTDLVAGLFLVSIGGGMVWKSRRTISKFKVKNEN